MTDEPEDESLDDRLERIQRRAENFRELLKEGDEVTIACLDGELHVDESYRSKFERKHTKLYGRMLSIEAQMDVGPMPYFLAVVAAAVFIIGLHVGLWNFAIGEAGQEVLSSWWFYLVLPAVFVFLVYRGAAYWARIVYGSHRQDLLALIADAQLDRDVIVVMLRDDDDVNDVVWQLKRDRGPFPP